MKGYTNEEIILMMKETPVRGVIILGNDRIACRRVASLTNKAQACALCHFRHEKADDEQCPFLLGCIATKRKDEESVYFFKLK